MAIWLSTVVLILVLAAIIRSEVRCGRKSKVVQHEVNQQINTLAKTTFERHREVFGRDPTGTFPVYDVADVKK